MLAATPNVARNQGERGVMINKKSVFGSSEFDISILSRYGMRPEYALQVPPLVYRMLLMALCNTSLVL